MVNTSWPYTFFVGHRKYGKKQNKTVEEKASRQLCYIWRTVEVPKLVRDKCHFFISLGYR